METNHGENKNNESFSRKVHTGAGHLFLTLLRKNRDAVDVILTDGRTLSGYIDAFDEQGIIVGSSCKQEANDEIYVTRQQIVTIQSKSPLSYLRV